MMDIPFIGTWIRAFVESKGYQRDLAKRNTKRGYVTATTPESALALDVLTQKKRKGAVTDITQGRLQGTNPTLLVPWLRGL